MDAQRFPVFQGPYQSQSACGLILSILAVLRFQRDDEMQACHCCFLGLREGQHFRGPQDGTGYGVCLTTYLQNLHREEVQAAFHEYTAPKGTDTCLLVCSMRAKLKLDIVLPQLLSLPRRYVRMVVRRQALVTEQTQFLILDLNELLYTKL